MFYLFMQTLFWIILAFVLGVIVGWWLRGRYISDHAAQRQDKHITSVAAAASTTQATKNQNEESRPIPDEPEVQALVSEDAVPVKEEQVKEEPVKEEPEKESTDILGLVADEWKPAAAVGDAKDDLKRIKGIGPVIERALNAQGIFTFQQISEFTQDNVKWVDSHINFPGRIDRENWVSQATQLASGGSTEFSARVDKGDVSY